MARVEERRTEDVRRELDREREQLASAVDSLRKEASLRSPVAPHGVIRFVESLQKDSSGGASVVAFAIGLVGALWAASGAAGAVMKAVNRAYGFTETRPFWKLRLIAVLLVVLTALTTAATLVLVIFGAPLGSAIANKAHLGTVWDVSWAILRWPVTLTALLTFFALVYYLAPNLEVRREVVDE